MSTVEIQEQVGGRRRLRRRWFITTLGAVLLCLILNLAFATIPVGITLAKDDRNATITLLARFGYYLDPTTLTLDLWDAGEASTADLTRVLFHVAASRTGWPQVRRVTFSRRGRPLFILPGEVFSQIGRLFEAGENPVYLMRTFPERLYLPSSERAFGSWEGGVLGVLTKQMGDLNDFGQTWALGTEKEALDR